MRLIILAALMSYTAISTASEREFQPSPLDGQEIRYEDGMPYAVAFTESARVTVSLIPNEKKSVFLLVSVANLGIRPFTVSDESVSVRSLAGDVIALTYRERVRALKRQEMWAGIATGLSAAANNINASNAGYQTHSGNYRSNTSANFYGSGGASYGSATTYGSYSGTSYNATAANLAQSNANAQNQALFDRQREMSEYAQKSLEGRALRANTIDPGQLVVGDVKIEIPRRNRKQPLTFTVDVNVDGEIISFEFREQT